MNRTEHLNWCKERALEYLENGEPENAYASMMSDLRKHPETDGHAGIALGVGLMMLPDGMSYDNVKRYVEGFN